jgi:hypothetical protein
LTGRIVKDRMLRPILGAIRVRYGLSVLEPVRQGEFWAVHGEVQRMTAPTTLKAAGKADPELDEARTYLGKVVKLIDAKQATHSARVLAVDDNKIVRLRFGVPLGGSRRLIKSLNAPVTAFLDAVKNGKPVAGLDISELTHPSDFVVNENGKFLIKPEYRVDGNWRKKFYGSFNSKAKAEKKRLLQHPYDGNDRTNGIAHPADMHLFVSNRRYWARGNYYDPNVKRFDATIDHDPAVVEHWNDMGGRMGVQKDRKAFFSQPPFEILPRFLNSSEGSGGIGLEPEVGPDFRGPREK